MRRWSGDRTASGTLAHAVEWLDRLPVAAALLAPDGVLTQWNPEAADLLDWRSAATARADAAADRAFTRLRESLHSHRGTSTLLSRRHAGTRTTVELHGRLQHDGSMLVTFNDCTAQLRARRERCRSEAALRAVIARDAGERLRAQEELRRSEEQLRHAQKMDAVGRLAAGIAHDFNNVLTAIQGHVQFLLEDLPSDRRSRAEVAGIQQAAGSAARLTRQLLTFARRQKTRPVAIEPDAVIAETDRLLRRLIRADIRLDTSLGAAARVFVDPGQLEQVLINLVVNARDALPDGGTITIRTSCVELPWPRPAHEPDAGLTPGEYVLLSVRDDGAGMSADVLRQAFEPFFTTKREGTGLGLPTAYGIVKQAGGHIEIDSAPGAGTTVHVFLPVHTPTGPRAAAAGAPDAGGTTGADPATPAAEPGPAATSAAEGGLAADSRPAATSVSPLSVGSGLVLLVEDDDSVRSLARRTLEYAGFAVIDATDGEEALGAAQVAGQPIDVLVTDLMMPRIGGEDLAAAISAAHPAVAVVLMSGFSEASLLREGRIRERRRFLEKPFTPAALVRTVREAMRSR